MRTIETALYTYSELSDEAKENAIESYRSKGYCDDDPWGKERREASDKAEGYYNRLGNIEGEIKGARLYTWIMNNLSPEWMESKYISKSKDGKFEISTFKHKYNGSTKKRRSRVFVSNELENCHLTGICYDMDFLQPIIDFLKKPDLNMSNIDLSESMPDSQDIADREYEYNYSDEAIKENLENGDFEFDEDGNIY